MKKVFCSYSYQIANGSVTGDCICDPLGADKITFQLIKQVKESIAIEAKKIKDYPPIGYPAITFICLLDE